MITRSIVGCLAIAATAHAGTVQSFDDIRFWVGDGANRSALAIDWDGDSAGDQALVWGYRWDGAANGEAMLRDLLAADSRLFAKLGRNGLGVAALGLGYDLNGDGEFAIDDGTVFDADGIANVSFSNADGASSVDGGDLYREGWEDAYWHYSTAASGVSGPEWTTSNFGPSALPLVDGEWRGLAIAVTLNADEFPLNLVAAEPPSLPGDFNSDGVVDAADYTVWRDAGGPPEDYDLWAAAYGEHAGAALSIPEPGAAPLVFSLFLLLGFHHREERV